MHSGLVVAGQHASHQVEIGVVVKGDRDGARLTRCYQQDYLAMVGLAGDSLVPVALVAGLHVLHCGVLRRESKLVFDHTIVGDFELDRLALETATSVGLKANSVIATATVRPALALSSS